MPNDNISLTQSNIDSPNDPQFEFGSLQLTNITNTDTSIDLNLIGDVTLDNVSVVELIPGSGRRHQYRHHWRH